jgi:hypothetical protein
MTKSRRKEEANKMTRNESTELEGRPHGRYYAEHVRVTGGNPEAQLQEVLDSKEGKEWHLVGVAGGLHGGGMVLFWDTAKPSFGRTAR